MLIEFQAVEEEALKGVGTRFRFARMDLEELMCGFFKLGKKTGRSPEGIRLICGINYGTRFDFERSGKLSRFATQDSAEKSENLLRTTQKFIGLCDSTYLQTRKKNSSGIWLRSGKPFRKYDALNLWNVIAATQNAVSTGNNDMVCIKTRRHLEALRRGSDETPLMFKIGSKRRWMPRSSLAKTWPESPT